MTALSHSPGTDLAEKADSALERLTRERRSWEEVRDLLQRDHPPQPGSESIWYLAVADASRGSLSELENWALAKAFEAGIRGSSLLKRLRDSYLLLDNAGKAAPIEWDLFQALVEEGRPEEGLEPLRRCLAQAPNPVLDAALSAGAATLGAYSRWAERSGMQEAWLQIRKALRKHVLRLFAGAGLEQDINLLVLDFTSLARNNPNPRPAIAEAFSDLLSRPNPRIEEPLGDTADVRMLWRDSNGLLLIDGKGASRLSADAAAFTLASMCAHFNFPESRNPIFDRQIPGQTPAESDPSRSLIEREGFALSNLGILTNLMCEYFGVQAMRAPDIGETLRRIGLSAGSYVRTGTNTDDDYGWLVHLYCRTNGLGVAWLSFLIRLFNPPYPFQRAPGVLGEFSPDSVRAVAESLRHDGFHIFERRLPPDLVDELSRFARDTPCYPHDDSGMARLPVIYPEGSPGAPKYDFLESDLVRSPAVQRLMCDPTLFDVSQAYLGCKPTLKTVSMWWSTVFSRTASAEAAQKWHFDLDHVQWVKWFIYLEDVDLESGPHCFIPGTHRAAAKHADLIKQGYKRIEDGEMEKYHPRDRILEITGPKGTIFVEDTSGFHKGKLPETRPRLILELEFNNSLFGGRFSRDSRSDSPCIPALRRMAASHPHSYRKFPFLRGGIS